jgi:hypothetical protein
MKMQIKLTDSSGRLWQGETILTSAEEGGGNAPAGSLTDPAPGNIEVRLAANGGLSPDYSLNPKAYTKRYGTGMTGARTFTLLIAYLAKGEVGKEVAFAEIEKLWNSMTSVIGNSFNRKYPNTAKTEGWVNSTSRGAYTLTSEWQAIFEKLRLAE